MTALRAVRRAALAAALLALVLGVGDREAVAPQATPELDVVVAVDRTTSMSALDDPSGSRITAVRRDLVALGDQLGPARLSVVTFGESATLRLPPTSDRDMFRGEAGSIQVEPADGGAGSSISRAVPLLEDLFDRSAKGPVERLPVLVLLSDGEHTSPEEQRSFTGLAGRTVASVVLGYGTAEGGPMPLERVGLDEPPPPAADPGPVVTDPATGEAAITRLDGANLERIAGQLGATYLAPAAPGESRSMGGVAAGLAEEAYAGLEPGRPQRELRWLWALLVIALVLPELRTGWRLWLRARREAADG